MNLSLQKLKPGSANNYDGYDSVPYGLSQYDSENRLGVGYHSIDRSSLDKNVVIDSNYYKPSGLPNAEGGPEEGARRSPIEFQYGEHQG